MSEATVTGQWFGLPVPAEARVAWGCRAILGGRGYQQSVDVVSDRCQMTPGPVPAAFAKWLRGPLAKWLHSEPRRTSKAYPQGRHSSRGIGYVDPGDDVLFTFHAAPFHAYASAKKSYGYLYVVAWMD